MISFIPVKNGPAYDEPSESASSRISEKSLMSAAVSARETSIRVKVVLGSASTTLSFNLLPGFAFDGTVATV